MYLKEEVMNRWIVPSNLEQYDVIGAFTDLPEVEWVQRLKSVEVGDVVYIYIGKPISAIKYACEVTAINLTDDDLIVDNDEDYIRKGGYIDEGSSTHMRLKKVYEFDDSILSWPILEKCGIKGPIQGARSVPEELIAYIDNLGIDHPLSSQQDASFEINYDKLHKLEEAFIVYEIAKHGVDPRDSLESTTLRDKNLEGYKKESFDKLHSMIEAGGPYSEILIQAFNNNNLASYHQKPSIEAIVNSDDADLLELALASLYEGNDDKSAFDEIVNVVGRNFDVVGLIFFLKDCEKYLPIRSRIFDRLFSYVDVKAALAANCSWEKYQDFISVIKDIQEDLKKKVNAEFSLLDAHSFVWILEGIHKYLDSGAQIVEHAKLGKGVVQSIDDEKITVKFADSKTPVTLLKSIAIDEEMFYTVREQKWEKLDKTEAAARFIYLNKTCFNGLYRVNRKGQFNVPFGKYKRPNICDAETIRAASKILQKAKIICGDYLEVLKKSAEPGDFVFLDPPYIPVSDYADFKRYTKEQFYEDDHIRLAQEVKRLYELGCYVILTNSNHPKVYELFSQLAWMTQR